MNDIEYDCPCVSFAFLVQKSKIDSMKHDREGFEEDQNQHQIMNFEYLNMSISDRTQINETVPIKRRAYFHFFGNM